MMANFYARLKKRKSALLILAIVLIGGWYYFGRSAAPVKTSYSLAKAEVGTVISSISGSGQVSDSNQLDLKPEVSAEINAIKVKAGQKVKAGDILAVLDDKDLSSQVRQFKNSLDSAEANLAIKLAGATDDEVLIAEKQVESAKLAYENAKLSLINAKANNEETLRKAQLSLDNAKLSLTNAEHSYDNSLASGDISEDSNSQSLKNAYSNAKSTVNTILISLRSSLVAADAVLGIDNTPSNTYLKDVLSVKNYQYLEAAESAYPLSKQALVVLESSISAAGNDWSVAETDKLLDEVLATISVFAEMHDSLHSALLASISSNNVSQASLDSYKSSISGQISSLNSHDNSINSLKQNIVSAKLGSASGELSIDNSLSSAESSLQSAKSNLITAQSNFNQTKLDVQNSLRQAESDLTSKKNSLETAEIQLAAKTAKPREIDLLNLRLQISQARENYQEALADLASANVKAPIDGVVAKVSQKVGDAASPATALLTLVTNKQLAAITMNEVDIVKIKSGQTATMSFSAIDSLEITGVVTDVDALGTVSSGVVSYGVNVALDTQDERVKPGMSVSVTITTGRKVGVIVVPSTAIKTDSSGASYVEIISDPSVADASGLVTSELGPQKKMIEVGLSSDTETEIKSGLAEGETYVGKTVAASSASASTQTQQSGFSLFGGSAPSGGATRMMR
jgi:HlyD family secretion protein